MARAASARDISGSGRGAGTELGREGWRPGTEGIEELERVQSDSRARHGHARLSREWCGRIQCQRERRKPGGIRRVGLIHRPVVDAVMRGSPECRARVARIAEVTRRDGMSAQAGAGADGGEGRTGASHERRQEEARPNQPGQPNQDASDRMHPDSQYSDSHGRRD